MGDDNSKELADKTHEGFEITCKRCGGNVVIVDGDVGFYAVSGGWGGISFKCVGCHYEYRNLVYVGGLCPEVKPSVFL